jgi:hypothetical protein
MRKVILLTSACALLLACKREPAPGAPVVVIDAREQAAPRVQGAQPADGAAAPGSPPKVKACEVEMFGTVKLPRGISPKKNPRFIYVADNDCLGDDAHILGRLPMSETETFFIEVFSRWGADLSVCAAVEQGEGEPTTLYGKAEGRYHAEAGGEVTFHGINVDLKKGPAHVFPKATPIQF